MSRSISVALAAHLAGESTTLCVCWWVKRRDAVVFGFTDHDQPLTVDGVTYMASSSFDASAVQTQSNFAVDNLEVTGVLSSDMITEADLLAGVWDYAEVRVFVANWADLSQGIMKQRRGWLGQVSISARGQFVAELRGMAQALQQQVGEISTPTCRADLGDARCKVALAAYTFSGTVGSVISNQAFTDAALTQADGYFAFGKVVWLTGANAGLTMEVKAFTAATDRVDLVVPMPYGIAVNDTYTIVAGCDRSRAMCRDKFANVLNIRCEPDLPGIDQILKAGKSGL